MINRRTVMVAAAFAAAILTTPVCAQDKSIVVSSTTSTQDSGLFGYILPLFKEKTGIEVKVIAQGTGQALDTGRRGDSDVVFVHAKSAEEKFLAEGEGVKRYPVMYNDFVLIGPKSDPAGIKGMISGGERQLVLLARALAQEPQFIVLDEPTASLDFGNQGKVMREIRALAKSGHGVLFTTHDPNHALRAADRAYLLREGVRIADGPVATVLNREQLEALYRATVERLTDPASGAVAFLPG